MTPLVQQLLTLLGVILGALAAYAATASAERSRWRRNQVSRHEDRRLKVYGEYALTVKRELSVILRVAASQRLPGSTDSMPLEEGRQLMIQAEDERTVAWESVLLVGSDAAVKAARAWHAAVARMYLVASGLEEAGGWATAVRATSTARREFYAVVRIDVGNEPSADPAIYEWQIIKLLDELPSDTAKKGNLQGAEQNREVGS